MIKSNYPERTDKHFVCYCNQQIPGTSDYNIAQAALRYYRGYINKLCTGILYDKHGQPHVCIDEYMKRHLEIKLISSIVTRAETV